MSRTTNQQEYPDFCGRVVNEDEIELIREVADSCGLSRTELASTVCELLDWTRPNGHLKTTECVQYLERLAGKGVINAPEFLEKPNSVKRKRKVHRTPDGEFGDLVEGSVSSVAPVVLERVDNHQQRNLWKELVSRYHYMGEQIPFGARLRYLIRISKPSEQVAGCLLFSSSAWSLKARDEWIGWSQATKKANLQKIVQNSRFLILPWIRVKGLASHVLSIVGKVLPKDWEAQYAIRPVLMETFVEKSLFDGTCYKAANWRCLGETAGRGRMDRDHENASTVKSIWVRELSTRSKQMLNEVDT